MGLGCLAEAVVVEQARAVAVPADLPLESLCLLGCGVTTGFGAAVNAAGIGVGATVAVLGCGAVGLSAVPGARLAGARLIIAVDPHPGRRALAEDFGAHHAIDSDAVDPFAEILALSGGGVDAVIEATGRTEVMGRALEAVHPGGTAVVVGLPAMTETFPVWPFHLLLEKKLTGSIYGSADPPADFPVLAELYRQGRLRLDELAHPVFTLNSVNEAFAELAEQRSLRPVVVMGR
jgi:S-(hydroxymethyl)glutathione dehydrogenase/alcohol dehydrogenase